jgi:hypothetical protein
MHRAHSPRFIATSERPAGPRSGRWRALATGGLALVTVAGVAASARAASPTALAPSAAANASPRLVIDGTSSRAIILSDPTGDLRATLSAGRIAVRGAHGLRFALSGPAIGRGITLAPVRNFAAPSLGQRRVTFSSPGADEWYARTPSGVEQGFIIADRRAGQGPLEIAQTISSNTSARLQAGGKGVRFGSKTRGLSYAHLAVTDATGAGIAASMRLAGHRLAITINDAHAVYPLRIDPVSTQISQST